MNLAMIGTLKEAMKVLGATMAPRFRGVFGVQEGCAAVSKTVEVQASKGSNPLLSAIRSPTGHWGVADFAVVGLRL